MEQYIETKLISMKCPDCQSLFMIVTSLKFEYKQFLTYLEPVKCQCPYCEQMFAKYMNPHNL